MSRISELSDTQLEKHYSEVFNDEYMNGLASWTESNGDEPFDATEFLDFARDEVKAIHEQTEKAMENFACPRS